MKRIVMLCALLLAACTGVRALGTKQAVHLYARAGDPVRFVFATLDGGSMGVVGEGPLRARCFVLGTPVATLSLGEGTADPRPGSVEALATRLQVQVAELPAEVTALWMGQAARVLGYWPGTHVPVGGVRPDGPHRRVGERSLLLFTLAPGRGFLIIAYYGATSGRVLRLFPTGDAFEVRPGTDLRALCETYPVTFSDFGRHLRDVARGRAVDWTNLEGYLD